MVSTVPSLSIPTLSGTSTEQMPFAPLDKNHSRLEKIVSRKLTATELSAAESMESEHASYGASRFDLKTKLPVNGPNHVAAIGNEAAAVAFDVSPEQGLVTLVYSSESHNGPSFVCAHPGAATGVGGRLRDEIAETGLKSEANIEARRQAHPLHNQHGDPVRQHTDETTKGIADYGNAMGVPHMTGSIKFDPRFAGNNLVNVMGIAISPASRLLSNKVPTTDVPGKFVGIYIGKASDATGIGGTKFASKAIDMTNSDLNEKAVQDPDPHLEEAVTRGIERVIDLAIKEGWKDKLSLKDMGAAGLLCSTVEQMHGSIGVTVYGDEVPQLQQRTATELLEAETQERFFIFVHEDHAQQVLDVFNKDINLPLVNRGAQAKIVARANDTGRYTFVRDGKVEVDLPTEDLMSGPLLFKKRYEPLEKRSAVKERKTSLKNRIEAVLGSINFKSDGYVYHHYDSHVRSTNVVARGEGAAPLRIHPSFNKGIGYSATFDSNAVIGLIDPKKQAEDSFVRGAYKMALVGASVVGVTNNANYGRTDVPEEMWAFEQGQEGIAKAVRSWELEQEYIDHISQDPEVKKKLEADPRRHVTVNSGNCSLNKANANTGTAIPPTTILGLAGWTNHVESHATWDLKPVQSSLYLIGGRSPELGASDYYQTMHGPDAIGNRLFDFDYAKGRREVGGVIAAVRKGLVAAGNDIEEGGLANAVAEMVANTSQPMRVQINCRADMGPRKLSTTQKLFSESYGVVLQVSAQQEASFLRELKSQGVHAHKIGSAVPAAHGSLTFTEKRPVRYYQDDVRATYEGKLEANLSGQHITVGKW
jgi:phosphoribosylformylglycinamidine (FGAM) synthase-like enzyme